MIIRLLRAMASFALIVIFAPLASAKPQNISSDYARTAPWNAETSDMIPDDRIVYGRLKNGLRYAIRPNAKPENQVLIRMVFEFGSAAEADNEQGLAHFIEHMAFNGSTNVPEGEMVRMLERLGLSFGADTNASTGFLQTTYMLDLPRKDPALLERALFLMRETASEVNFSAPAVDRERGVVLSEMRDGENIGFKRLRESFRLFYPDSFYAKRFPIGQKQVLEQASAEHMKALYRKWYVPDRARIIVVGPVDPVAVEKEINRKFASWRGSGAALGSIRECQFDVERPAGTATFTHPDIDEQTMVEQMLPDRQRADTMDFALLQMRMQIGWGIIADRLTRRARKEDIPFLYAYPNFEAGFCKKHARVGFIVGSKDGGWKATLPMVEQTIRQAVIHGFSENEMTEQLKRMDAGFANAVKSEPTLNSGAFAGELVANEDNIISSAEYRRLAWLQLKPFLTAQSVQAELAKWYGKLDRPQIFLATKKGDPLLDNDLLKTFQASRATAVDPPIQRTNSSWAYTDFGPPGKVTFDQNIAALGIRKVKFDNGVLLNIKRTDFEADTVRIGLTIDGGWMQFGFSDLPLLQLMNGAYAAGGLGKHEIDDIRAILAGTTVDTNLSSTHDSFISSATVVPKDVEQQLQMMAALLTDPGYREDAVKLFQRPLPETYARLDATPGSALNNGLGRTLYLNDPRFSTLPLESLMRAQFKDLKALLSDALIRNRMEIGIVGDIDEDRAIALVAKTLAALPQRKTETVIMPAARLVRQSDSPGQFDFKHRGEANQMAWRRVWKTTDNSDLKLSQTMTLLSEAVQIRLLDELRERLGASYSANAGSSMWKDYPGIGHFTISTNGDPKDAAKISDTVDAVIAEFIAKPMNADLFERARKPTLESYRDWRKKNSTWFNLVKLAQTEPIELERFQQNEDLFRSITAEDIWKAAQRFLKDQKPFTFRSLPEKSAGDVSVSATATGANGATPLSDSRK